MGKYVNSKYVSIDASGFQGNLGPMDTDLQRALETLDAANYDVVHIVGNHTPSGAQEYPDTTGQEPGAGWVVYGLGSGNSYTFTAGDLAGMSVIDGDIMSTVDLMGQWAIVSSSMNASLYYRVDGGNALTADFQAGGFKLVNVAEATDNSDVPNWGQVYPRTGGTLAGTATILGNVHVRDNLDVGINPNGNSAIAFNWDETNGAGTQVLFFDNADNKFKVDITGNEGYELWHSGNFNPDDKFNITGGVLSGTLSIAQNYNFRMLNTGVLGNIDFRHTGSTFSIIQTDDSGSATNYILVYNDEIVPELRTQNGEWNIGYSNPIWHSNNFNPHDKENVLGNPSANGYVLSSDTSGNRSWIPMTGGGCAATFLDLTDVPDNYTGSGGMYVKVNQSENGLVFEEGSGITVYFADILGAARDNASLNAELTTHDNAIQANTDRITALETLVNDMFEAVYSGNTLTQIKAKAYLTGVDEVEGFGS